MAHSRIAAQAWLGTVVLACVGLVGCRQNVDLSAVRDMSKAAQDAQISYAELSADYFASCVRKVELSTIGSAMKTELALPAKPALATPPPSPSMKKTAVPAPTPRPTPMPRRTYAPGLAPSQLKSADPNSLATLTADQFQAFDAKQVDAIVMRGDIVRVEAALKADQRDALAVAASNSGTLTNVYSCKGAGRVAEQWRRRNDILIGYFAALGKLAGGSVPDDRFGIAGLGSSLQSAGVFNNDQQTQAFQKLSNDVLGHIFDWKRRDALADDLAKGQPLIDDIVKQLSSVAAYNYKFQIRQERDALTDFRNTNLLYAERGAQAFQVYRYAKAVKSDIQGLNAREAAADAYIASLDKLAKAHATVVDSVKKNDLASGIAAAKLYYDDVHSDVQTIHKAFSGGS